MPKYNPKTSLLTTLSPHKADMFEFPYILVITPQPLRLASWQGLTMI